MDWIKERASEPSTWRGLGLLLSLFGVTQADGIAQSVSVIAAGGIGLYDIIRKSSQFAQKR
jgi:hypothetical protein